MNNLEHYLDLGHVFFTKLGWKYGKLKATVDPGTLPGCHLVRNGNLCGIYLGLNDKGGENVTTLTHYIKV